MKRKKVEEIIKKIEKVWTDRLKSGYYENIKPATRVDKSFLESIRKMLLQCPDDDGYKRVADMSTGLTHLVPYEMIILDGLKGTELHKFPLDNNPNITKV